MDIMELIPSADVRAHIQETGHIFSDWDQASILFNLCGLTLAEKAVLLRKLESQTQDESLAVQIKERLEFEQKAQDIFFKSAPNISMY